MKKIDLIKQEWQKSFDEMMQSPGFKRIQDGDITVEHYKSVMRQIFHHARENPQIQAMATVFFRGKQREMVKKFFWHATSEIGHDQLALKDLKTLGVDITNIPYEKPLPATSALIAYAFYQIQHLNPVGYLGYLFHLEFMPTKSGKTYMEALKKIGVPEEAMIFIDDHSTIDVGHNKYMEDYIEQLIQTDCDLTSVIYAAKTTARLYAHMVQEAFEHVDKPQTWGISYIERTRMPSNSNGVHAMAV